MRLPLNINSQNASFLNGLCLDLWSLPKPLKSTCKNANYYLYLYLNIFENKLIFYLLNYH